MISLGADCLAFRVMIVCKRYQSCLLAWRGVSVVDLGAACCGSCRWMCGGVINALITERGFKMPGWEEVGSTRIWTPGWITNVVIGAAAAIVSWGLYGPYANDVLVGEETSTSSQAFVLTLSSVVGAFLVGGRRFTVPHQPGGKECTDDNRDGFGSRRGSYSGDNGGVCSRKRGRRSQNGPDTQKVEIDLCSYHPGALTTAGGRSR